MSETSKGAFDLSRDCVVDSKPSEAVALAAHRLLAPTIRWDEQQQLRTQDALCPSVFGGPKSTQERRAIRDGIRARWANEFAALAKLLARAVLFVGAALGRW